MHPLVPDEPGEQDQRREVPHEAAVGVDEDAAPRERTAAAAKRVHADGVEDDVPRLAAPCEVLPEVVDHVVRPERPDELDATRVAHGGHARAEVLRKLDARRPDGARRAVDEHALAVERAGLAQAGQRERGAIGDPGRLLERDPVRDARQRPRLADADELRVGAPADAEDGVADGEGELEPRDPLLLPAQADDEPREPRLPGPHSDVGAVHGRGVHADEHPPAAGTGGSTSSTRSTSAGP